MGSYKIIKSLILAVLIACTMLSKAQNNISSYSYWFDNELSGMETIFITPVSQYTLNASLPTDGISTGIHSFNIQFLDDSSHSSGVISRYFFKAPVPDNETKEIVEISYWYDENIEGMETYPVGPSPQLLLNSDLDVADLSTGIHSVNVRFKDNAGIWSSPASCFFFKATIPNAEERQIIAFKYWVDGAFLNANYQTVDPNQTFVLSDIADLDTLSEGFHIIHAQFRDNSKLWSSPISSSFYKLKVNSSSDNFVTACKYWFDEDLSTVEEIVFADPVNPRILLMDIDMTNIWKGEHRLHFQFKDSLNLWGAVTTDTVVKNPLPVAIFTCDASICFGDTIHFTNNSVDADTYFWDLGDGTTTTDSIPEFHVYDESGTYTVSLTVTDLGTGLDSTATQIVNVYEIPSPELTLSGDPEFCEGGSVDISAMPGMIYEWSTGETTQSITVSTSGSYHAEIYNAANQGCWIQSDTAIIDVLNVDTTTMDAIICEGESYTFGGQILTEPGTYTEIFLASSGCDSVVNLTLDVTVLDTSVTVNFPVLTANLENALYQWVDCNNGYEAISGANEQSFTPEISGNYAVVLEMESCSDTSSCYNVNLTGLEFSSENQLFTASPNPTTGQVNLQLGEKGEVSVIDGLGNRIYDVKLEEGKHLINLDNSPKGIYILVFTGQSFTKQIKLIKSK